MDNPAGAKALIRSMMEPIRCQILRDNTKWIDSFEPTALSLMADGSEIIAERVAPVLELVESPMQRDLWRYCRYLSSMPYSNYIGRRMYFLIRDYSIDRHPIMGIAAIGSSVMQIGDRDRWIGWDRETKRNRIVYMMDLYTAVSVPPYSQLLTGKLILYMMASNELRELYAKKYACQKTMTTGRYAKDLVLLCTTSMYGTHSSQYNRVRYQNQLLYIPVGETVGFGTFHISPSRFRSMRKYLRKNGLDLDPNLSTGVNWRMRVARTYFQTKMNHARAHLKHGFRRGIFVAPLASNAREFLCGKAEHPDYFNWPLEDLVRYWKERWLFMRIQNHQIMEGLRDFRRGDNRLSLQMARKNS
jgi:hypothetical protein